VPGGAVWKRIWERGAAQWAAPEPLMSSPVMSSP